MFPNISFYLGLEMCTAPFKKISVPPLVVQVQLWLQEKCHCKAHSFWNAEELSLEKFSMVFYLHLSPPCSQAGWRDTLQPGFQDCRMVISINVLQCSSKKENPGLASCGGSTHQHHLNRLVSLCWWV